LEGVRGQGQVGLPGPPPAAALVTGPPHPRHTNRWTYEGHTNRWAYEGHTNRWAYEGHTNRWAYEHVRTFAVAALTFVSLAKWLCLCPAPQHFGRGGRMARAGCKARVRRGTAALLGCARRAGAAAAGVCGCVGVDECVWVVVFVWL